MSTLRPRLCRPVLGGLLLGLFGTLGASPAGALGRCDVAPLGAPDGRVEVADALAVLRQAVRLTSGLPLARADVAPVELLLGDVVAPRGDGRIAASDALVCLRVAVESLHFPANLGVSIESVAPARPPVGSNGTARIVVRNDGDALAAAGGLLTVRLGELEPATATLDSSLAPGEQVALDVDFPAGDQPGSFPLRAQVEPVALDLLADDDVATLAVVVNGAPTADAGSDRVDVLEGAAVALQGSGNDPNGDALEFAWTQEEGPAATLENPAAAELRFQAPDIAVETDLVFALRVRDPDGLVSAPSTVRVALVPINDDPVVTTPPDPQEAPERADVTLSASVSDPNQDPLTLVWVQVAGEPVTFDGQGTDSLRFTMPVLLEPALFRFELLATDDEGAIGVGSITVLGMPVNDPPVASASAPASLLEGSLALLDARASTDPDGDLLRFAWSQTQGPPVELTDADQPAAAFVAPEAPAPALLGFAVRVEDPMGEASTASVSVEVLPDPRHPAQLTLRASPPAVFVDPGSLVLLEVEVTARDPEQTVPDGTEVELSTSLGTFADGSNGLVAQTRLGRWFGTLAPGAATGEAVVHAAAVGASAADERRIQVHAEPNALAQLALVLDPPVVGAGLDTPVRVIARALPADERGGTVPDGTLLSFSADAGSFPAGAEAATASGIAQATFQPPAQPGSFDVRLSANGVEAAATLRVVGPGALRPPHLESDAAAVVAGGEGTELLLRIASELPDETIGPLDVSFAAAEGGRVDGVSEVVVQSEPAEPDADVPPFGDFPGPGDTDGDADGLPEVADVRVAHATFAHPDALETSRAVPVSASLPGGGVGNTSVRVVPGARDPVSLGIVADSPTLVAGGAALGLRAALHSADGDPADDGIPISFEASSGSLSPAVSETSAGEATADLAQAAPFPLPAQVLVRAGVADLSAESTLLLAPEPEAPVLADVSIEPYVLAADGASEALVRAVVLRADGGSVPDGTRVVFGATRGVPSAAFAETRDGVAEIRLLASSEPGFFDVRARVAGTVAAATGRGVLALPGVTLHTFGVQGGAGVGSLTAEFSLPEGARPVSGSSGVRVELVPASQGGIASSAAFGLGSERDGRVRVAVIDARGFAGDGPLFRLSFELPPAGRLPCEALGELLVEATDVVGSPITGASLGCFNP